MGINKLNWFPLADGLVDFLKNYTYNDGTHLFNYLVDYDSLKINVGQCNTGEFPLINILFGEESEMEFPNNIKGATVQLWIDIYVKGIQNNNQEEVKVMYTQLYRAEKELLSILKKYAKLMEKQIGSAINIIPQGVLSDGDENLPATAQHRLVLDIIWRN